MISANALRTRQLPRTNAGSEVNSSNNFTASGTTGISVTQELRQPLPNARHILLTNPMILDNVVMPVVYGDRTIDILPYQFRRSDKRDVPQFFNDISLDRLVSILAQKFQTDRSLEVWGMNSRCFFIQLEDDDHLRVALISFVLFLWQSCQNTPCLEVRPLLQSASH